MSCLLAHGPGGCIITGKVLNSQEGSILGGQTFWRWYKFLEEVGLILLKLMLVRETKE